MKICVVEDETYFIELFEEAISGIGEIELRIARSATEAQYLCEQERAYLGDDGDIVFFVDIRMERSESGLDFLRFLKQDEDFKVAPVVMISSSVKQRHVDTSFQLGAASFVSKGASARATHSAFRDAVKYWHFTTRRPHVRAYEVEREKAALNASSSAEKIPTKRRATLLETVVSDLFSAIVSDLSKTELVRSAEPSALHTFRSLFLKSREIFEFHEETIPDRANAEIMRFYNIIDSWINHAENYGIDERYTREMASEAKKSRTRIRSAFKRYGGRELKEQSFVVDVLWRHMAPIVHEYPSVFPKTSGALIRLRDRFID